MSLGRTKSTIDPAVFQKKKRCPLRRQHHEAGARPSDSRNDNPRLSSIGRLTTRVSVRTDERDGAPVGPTGFIFPNFWLVSVSARSKCQSPRQIDRGLVRCLILPLVREDAWEGGGKPKIGQIAENAIGPNVWGGWVETSRQSRTSH